MRFLACELVRFDGTTLRTDALTRDALVVVPYSFACPYARAYDARLAALAETYVTRAHVLCVVCSDPARYPEDHAPTNRLASPYVEVVRDPTEELCRALDARVASEAFVFDRARVLTYRGRIDDAPFHPGDVTVPYLARALEATLAGAAAPPSTRAIGTPLAYR